MLDERAPLETVTIIVWLSIILPTDKHLYRQTINITETIKTKLVIMRYLKLLLAAMLLLCLLHMPYGYYEFVRFVSMVAFAVMAYGYYKKKQEALAVVFGALALLFQPLIKIALGRTMWNIVDVVVALLLVGLWLKEILDKNRPICIYEEEDK